MSSRPESPLDLINGNPLKTHSPILSWDTDKINHWLKTQGMEKHSPLLLEQRIDSGAVLLQLTEEHFKDMGISSIGERLALVNAIDRLRIGAGYSPSAKFFDTSHLLDM